MWIRINTVLNQIRIQAKWLDPEPWLPVYNLQGSEKAKEIMSSKYGSSNLFPIQLLNIYLHKLLKIAFHFFLGLQYLPNFTILQNRFGLSTRINLIWYKMSCSSLSNHEGMTKSWRKIENGWNCLFCKSFSSFKI